MGVENQLEKHREHLVLARQSSQDSYDKAILSLSGGALGILIAFIDKLAADAPLRPGLLLTSWSCWAISLILILFSHFFSHRSLTHAIAKLDRDEDDNPPGGVARRLTELFNVAAGLAFVSGVGFMVAFAYINVRR